MYSLCWMMFVQERTCEPDIMMVVIVARSDSGAHLSKMLLRLTCAFSDLANMLVMQGKVAASHSPISTLTMTSRYG